MKKLTAKLLGRLAFVAVAAGGSDEDIGQALLDKLIGFSGERARCPDCGVTKIDEDGCCTACGADTTFEPCRWVSVPVFKLPEAPR